MRLFLSLPVQLVIVICAVLFFGTWVPLPMVRGALTFSLAFKEILSLFLPLIIFSFVLSGILSLKKNVPIILGVMIALILCSNAVVALCAYLVGSAVLPHMTNGLAMQTLSLGTDIVPFWQLALPISISSEKALIGAICLGIGFSLFPIPWFETLIFRIKAIVEKILTYGFIPLLPLYVLGFLLEVQHKGVFMALVRNYGRTFFLILALQFLYLAWIYFVASGFSRDRFRQAVQTALPSYLTAFSTMSSTATIPVTITAATKNTGNGPLAQIATPIMANVHLLGDAMSTPILAFVTMMLFAGGMPDFSQYAIFVVYFCMTMLAVSAVPGGGIIVMIPILRAKLGFSPEMISIITMLYMLHDAFSTAANVMGDGALMMILNKILRRLRVI